MNIIRNNRVQKWMVSYTTILRNYSNTNSQKRFAIEPLDQRQLVRVGGDDVITFLQGLTTCDMRQMQSSPQTTSMYTMFLNKAGRVLYDAIMYRTSSDPSTILIECDKDISNDLMRHLKLYRVRRKIQIDSVIEEFKVWCVFPSGDSSNNISNIQVPTNTNGVEITEDPRLMALGHRVVSSADKVSSEISKLYTDLSDAIVEPSSSAFNYRLYRYSLGVAEGVLDMPPGKQFPLEANCDLLKGVSFNKGCYIGQELTARVHHTGVIRKRHMPVQLKAPLTSNSTMTMRKEGDTKVGNILGSIDNRAIGLLRIEQVMKSQELLIDGKPCCVEIPKWWPPSLFNNLSIKEGV